MSNSKFEPVTLMAGWGPNYPSKLIIGSRTYNTNPNDSSISNAYWYIVVDRRDLSVPFNQLVAGNSEYPKGLDTFLGSSNYYIWISTKDMKSDQLPVGNLLKLMESLGATANLTKALQIANQIGTGTFELVTYSMASSTDQRQQSAFDQYSFFQTDALLVPLMFGSVQSEQGTIWILGEVRN